MSGIFADVPFQLIPGWDCVTGSSVTPGLYASLAQNLEKLASVQRSVIYLSTLVMLIDLHIVSPLLNSNRKVKTTILEVMCRSNFLVNNSWNQ